MKSSLIAMEGKNVLSELISEFIIEPLKKKQKPIIERKESLLKKYEQAKVLFFNNQYEDALRLYNEIDTPRLPLRERINVFYRKGFLFMHKVESLNNRIANFQKDARLGDDLYAMLIEKQAYSARAIEMYEKVIRFNKYPESYAYACVHYYLGNLYYSKKEGNEAEKNYLKALLIADAVEKECSSKIDSLEAEEKLNDKKLSKVIEKSASSKDKSRKRKKIDKFKNVLQDSDREKKKLLDQKDLANELVLQDSDREKMLLDQKDLANELGLKISFSICQMILEKAIELQAEQDYADCYKYALRLTASKSDYYRFVGYSYLTLGNNSETSDTHTLLMLANEGIEAYDGLDQSSKEMDTFIHHYNRLVEISVLYKLLI